MENMLKQKSEELLAEKKQMEEKIRALFEQKASLERELAAKTADASEGETTGELVRKAIRETSKAFPRYASVACQGVQGAYSQEAAEKVIEYPNIVYVKSFDAVFAAIEKGLCDYGMLPIENSTAGSVNRIYDLMQQHHFYIVKSLRVKINHSLLVKAGTKKSQITDIYSHEQAIAQCAEYIKTMPLAVVHVVENTAMAAKLVAEGDSSTSAAIASMNCIGEYPLEVLEESVQDRNDNYTRFICISKKCEIYPGADRTSVMAVLPHKKGSLYRILKVMNDYDCNLTKLESRPRQDKDFEFQFYFDFETSVYEENYCELLDVLAKECEELVYLGSYHEII